MTLNSFSSIDTLAFDLDGTLLNSRKELSSRNKEALLSCFHSGFHLFIATARPPRSVKQMLPEEILNCVTAIYYNGAFVENVDGATLSLTIPETVSSAIVNTLCDCHERASIAIESEDVLYALTDEAYANNKKHLSPPTLVSPDDMKMKPANKILLFNLSSMARRSVMHYADQLNIVETDAGELIQIMDGHVSKATTLAALCAKSSLSMAHMMAFGDDWNDLEMFQSCGYSVAMGNAVPELKRLADRTTQSNDEDGVAHVLDQILAKG